MTLIDVIASEPVIHRRPSRSGHVLSAMSKNPGRALDGPVGLEKCVPYNEVKDHGAPSPGVLVNGSITMVPRTADGWLEAKQGSAVVTGESTSLKEGEIDIANVPGQESGKGNRPHNSGSNEGQTSAEDRSVKRVAHNALQAGSVELINNNANAESDCALQRSEDGDFPGDGSESGQVEQLVRRDAAPPLVLTTLEASRDTFGEISEENASELLEQLEKPPDSPATIDVTEITQLQASQLQRPCDLGKDLRDSSTGTRDIEPAMVRESPARVTPITPSTSVPVLPVNTQTGVPSHGDGASDDQVDGGSRSRTSTATSQSTEPEFVEVNLQGQYGPSSASVVQPGAKPKKKGLSGFLAKNFFGKPGRKNEARTSVNESPSWGLFGQTPPGSPSRSPHQLAAERQQKGHTHPPTSSNSWKNRKSGMKYASSTTALILEDRPPHLPAKNPEEQQRHYEEYEQMVQGAKKKELKYHKKQLKDMEIRLRHEDGIQLHLQTWQEEILPNWEAMKNNKKTKDLWWQGIPPSIRGRVWMLAIGNELNITPELFEIFLLRAKDRIKYISGLDSEEEDEEANAGSREDSVDVIKLDVARTFPHLCIFQKGGPFYEPLHSVLGAYASYRPDVGYLQGMSFIAAVFLLYLDPPQAFHCFANLLNKSCLLAFFRLDQQVMKSYFNTYEEYFQLYMPRLYRHFNEQNLRPDIYILDWIFTLYIKSLPLDVACVVLDVFFRDGEEFLFRTALGILKHFEEVLLQLDFIQIAQFLCKLPSDLTAESLFQSIALIDVNNHRKFKEVLAGHLAQALTSS